MQKAPSPLPMDPVASDQRSELHPDCASAAGATCESAYYSYLYAYWSTYALRNGSAAAAAAAAAGRHRFRRGRGGGAFSRSHKVRAVGADGPEFSLTD